MEEKKRKTVKNSKSGNFCHFVVVVVTLRGTDFFFFAGIDF